MQDNLLSQIIYSPTRGDAILDLMVTKISELVGDLKTGDSLGCSDHAVVELTLLRNMGQAKNKIRTLNFRDKNRTFWKLPSGTSQQDRVGRSLRTFSIECLIHRSKKSGKEGKRLVWLSRDLLVKLQGRSK